MKIGVVVYCEECGRSKAPCGRSVPLGTNYCTYDQCKGYSSKPFAGSLFPGETEDEFGYLVGEHGTRDIAKEEVT